MKKRVLLLLFTVFLLTACGAQPTAPTYDEMKKMMTDSLQTEEGKKAVRQMFSDPEFKELLILEQPVVKKSVEDTLLSKKGEDFWKKTFEDPKFNESFAKSVKEQQQEIMKQLMDDASFQKQMEEFFSQPDMLKQLETVTQSANMKKHLEKVVQETINSPLMQTKWQELILKAGDPKAEESGGGGGGGGGGESEKNKSGGGQ